MAKVSTTTETITPGMAESWLEKNKDNRPVRDHHVKMLAKEMQEGRWKLNGEALVFDHNGNLLDGQHRLWASYTYQPPFETVVVRGVEPEAFATIDSGMKRSAGDVLAKAGLSYGTLTASALRLVHFYETGRRDHLAVSRMSNSETLELISKYPRISAVVPLVGARTAFKKLLSMTAMSAVMYFAMEEDMEAANSFLEALATGENLRRGDPRLTCRNFFLNARQRGGRVQHHRVQFALLIKAWNAWRLDKDMGQLRYAEGEEFPEFVHRLRGKKPTMRVARVA